MRDNERDFERVIACCLHRVQAVVYERLLAQAAKR
jgi:hypothetical protein